MTAAARTTPNGPAACRRSGGGRGGASGRVAHQRAGDDDRRDLRRTASYAVLGEAYGAAEVERSFGLIAALVCVLGSVLTPIALGVALDRFGHVGAAVAKVAAAVLALGGCALYRSHDRHRVPPEMRDA